MDITGAVPSVYGHYNGGDANFRALENTLSRDRAESAKEAKDIEKTIFQNRYDLHDNILKAKGELADRISDSSALTIAGITESSRRSADAFAASALAAEKNTATILAAMSATELRKVQDQLNELRERGNSDRFGYHFGLQNQEISSLKQMINSVEQTQRFSSKTVQFGTGNLAGTAQTANQG